MERKQCPLVVKLKTEYKSRKAGKATTNNNFLHQIRIQSVKKKKGQLMSIECSFCPNSKCFIIATNHCRIKSSLIIIKAIPTQYVMLRTNVQLNASSSSYPIRSYTHYFFILDVNITSVHFKQLPCCRRYPAIFLVRI